MEEVRKILTICIIRNNQEVLLGLKKRGFGQGRWNGFGGHVETNEDIEEAAKREVYEESGLEVQQLREVGVIEFEFVDDPEILEVHIFVVTGFKGKPRETGEMRPQWFQLDKIPYGEMWPCDRQWLPELLEGKRFLAYFLYDNEVDCNILDSDLTVLD